MHAKSHLTAADRCNLRNDTVKHSVWYDIEFYKIKMLVGAFYGVPNVSKDCANY